MEYKLNESFHKDLGFHISGIEIFKAVQNLNSFLVSLPPNLYKSIDFKTTGALIGAVFCVKLAEQIRGAVVNPIEKGYPDIIPIDGLNSSEEILRNYPKGLEVKGTIGNLKTGQKLNAGEQRISHLRGITWQAHHRDGKQLLGFIWDFINMKDGFCFPAITAVYFSDQLDTDDWGKISGTTGRNTKVTGMMKSGKKKMGNGCVLIIDDETYINRYNSLLL